MNKELLKRFADLKLQGRRVKEELELLQDAATREVAAITGDSGSPVELPGYGKFTVYPKKTWLFSNTVEEVRGQLADMEKEEKANGTAQFTEELCLRFAPLTEGDQDDSGT